MARRSLFAALVLFAGATASAQMLPGGPGPGSGPGMPSPVTLTKDAVERLLKAIPEVTKEGAAQHQRMLADVNKGGTGEPRAEDLQKLQAIITKHGFTMENFQASMSTMIATYMTLDPAALDSQIPTESTPEVKKVLDDPSLPAEQKELLKQQLAQAQKGKEALRQQFSTIATDDNKKAVKPFMAQIKKVLADAESEAKKALTNGGPAALPGPRRQK
jgi:hypothetical protein